MPSPAANHLSRPCKEAECAILNFPRVNRGQQLHQAVHTTGGCDYCANLLLCQL